MNSIQEENFADAQHDDSTTEEYESYYATRGQGRPVIDTEDKEIYLDEQSNWTLTTTSQSLPVLIDSPNQTNSEVIESYYKFSIRILLQVLRLLANIPRQINDRSYYIIMDSVMITMNGLRHFADFLYLCTPMSAQINHNLLNILSFAAIIVLGVNGYNVNFLFAVLCLAVFFSNSNRLNFGRRSAIIFVVFILSLFAMSNYQLHEDRGVEMARFEMNKRIEMAKIETPIEMAKIEMNKGIEMARIEMNKGMEMARIEMNKGIEMARIEMNKGMEMARIEMNRGMEMARIEMNKGMEMARIETPIEMARIEMNKRDRNGQRRGGNGQNKYGEGGRNGEGRCGEREGNIEDRLGGGDLEDEVSIFI